MCVCVHACMCVCVWNEWCVCALVCVCTCVSVCVHASDLSVILHTPSTPCMVTLQVFKDVPLPLDTTASAHSLTSDKLVEKKTLDLLTSGNVIGEKSILTGERTATGTSCETDVQVRVMGVCVGVR